MTGSPQQGSDTGKEGDQLVTIPQIPALLEAAGLKKIGPARIRQLAASDDDWPRPAFEHGRVRLFLWPAVERYFRTRTVRQGERTDIPRRESDNA